MSAIKKIGKATEETKPKVDAIEINLPDNLSDYLTPISVILGTIVVAVSIFVMGGRLEKAITNIEVSTTGTTADTTGQAQAEVTVTEDQIASLFDRNVIKIGNKDSNLTFVEFSDPSCPYCHIAGGSNPELSKEVGAQFQYDTDGGTYVPPVREMKKLVQEGKASYIYVFTVGHGNGELGAKALYCANDQGKFWEAHDMLMTNDAYTFLNEGTGSSSIEDMSNYLASVTNKSTMSDCLTSGKYDATITENIQIASELGVSGTPGFFVNTSRFAGAYSFSEMQDVVDAALN